MKTKEQIEAKIARNKARVECRNAYKSAMKVISGRKPKVKGENTCLAWDDPKLVAKRKAKKEHIKKLAVKHAESFKSQAINYIKKQISQTEAQARYDMFLITAKQAKAKSAQQSKEDKAKHKASLIEFKTKYVRTYKVGNTQNPVKGTGVHKRNMEKYRRKYSISVQQAQQAA